MKKLLIPLLAALLLCGCAATYDGPATTVMVLNETRTEGFWDSGELAYSYRTVYAYDIYGNQAQWIEYIDDEAIEKRINRYDEQGNLLRSEDYDLEGWFPKRTSRTECTYDDLGRVTSVTHDYGGGDKSSYTVTYDDEANTQTNHYTDSISVRYYNDAGHLTRIEHSDAEGNLIITDYTLRPDGQHLSATSITNGVVDFSMRYEYDDQGRPIRQFATENGVETEQQRWEYNDEEHYAIRYNSNGSYQVTGYNADGTEKVQEFWDESGKLQSRTIYYYREIRVPVQEETP